MNTDVSSKQFGEASSRLKIFVVSQDDMFRCLMPLTRNEMIVHNVLEIPDGAIIRSVDFDFSWRSFMVLVEHESFDPALPGCMILKEPAAFVREWIRIVPTDEPGGIGHGLRDDCECVGWARDGNPPFTSHHPNCPHGKPMHEVLNVTRDLLRGIKAWADDEDGVHPDAWDAYRRGQWIANGKTIEDREE